ncbi:hypothetical protein GCM10007919_01580 [Rhizobium indigoferae]|nr:hypothetical protein GCM10007919_01580 [Rhizobium indigoferae]
MILASLEDIEVSVVLTKSFEIRAQIGRGNGCDVPPSTGFRAYGPKNSGAEPGRVTVVRDRTGECKTNEILFAELLVRSCLPKPGQPQKGVDPTAYQSEQSTEKYVGRV